MYVLPEAFDADMPYVEAYVSVEGAAELPADSDAYDDRVAGVVAAIEGIASAREQARVDGLKAEAQADLDEARAEYEKEEARAKTELADARAELDEMCIRDRLYTAPVRVTVSPTFAVTPSSWNHMPLMG